MKILFLSDLWLPFPGGAEHYIASLAREMAFRGNEVGVLTNYGPVKDRRFSILLEPCLGSSEPNNKEQRLKILENQILNFKPDCIFVHRFFAEEYGSFLARLNVRLVEVVHQHKHVHQSDLTVYNSEYTKRQNTTERSHPNMVILPPVYPEEVVGDTHGDKIGFVKPVEHKGAKMFYLIAESSPRRNFLVLQGEWKCFEDRREKENIEFIGPVAVMSDFYSRCRAVLMPSLSEDAGTIPLECGLVGIPCISSNVMGLPETNAGGIQISRPNYLECWLEEIRKLDGERYYQEACEKQKAHVAQIKWVEKFNELAARIQ